MSRRRHCMAVAICVVMLLCVVASSALVAHEAAFHYRCVGNHCPICQFIEQVEQVRRAFGAALLALLPVCFALVASRERHDRGEAGAPALCTLVGRKIQLND